MSTITLERTPLQKEIDAEVLERVKRGLAWLEEKHGPGWEDHIDLEILNLSSGTSCVLGQVYDDEAHKYYGGDGFTYAIRHFEMEDEGASMGFCIEDMSEPWEPLQEAWEHVLTPLVGKPE